jgi:DNA-binding transcriptional regulator YhcF (GntR family)
VKWEIDEKLPIHNQIIDEIIRRVVNKEYLTGQRIPSVRELSAEAKVNPNTMQKALQELEDRKILYTHRTSGKFVTENEEIINNLKSSISNSILNKFIKDMKDLGFNQSEIIEMLGKE